MKNIKSFVGLAFFLLVFWEYFGPALYQAGGGPYHDAKVAEVKAMKKRYGHAHIENHSLQEIRDQFTTNFARYDFESLRAGAVAGSVCGAAKVANMDRKVIHSDWFYFDGHEVHSIYSPGCDGHEGHLSFDGYEEHSIYGYGINNNVKAWPRFEKGLPRFEDMKEQKSPLSDVTLKPIDGDPPVRFKADPERLGAQPSGANPFAGKALSNTILHDAFSKPPVASSSPNTTIAPPVSDRHAE